MFRGLLLFAGCRLRQTHCCGKQTVRASRLVQIVRWWLPRTLASRRIPGGTTCPQFTRCRSAISCLMVTTRSERPSSHAEAARFSSSGLPIPQPDPNPIRVGSNGHRHFRFGGVQPKISLCRCSPAGFCGSHCFALNVEARTVICCPI